MTGAYELLATSPRGLSPAEVAARQALYGSNELPAARRAPILLRFAAQLTDMFAVVLLVSAALTFLAYVLQQPHDTGTLRLGVAIVGVVVLNAAIGFGQEYVAERTIEALQAMVPRLCRVVRGGERLEVRVADLVPGDIVVLDAGDAVPADCRVVESHALAVNNAALTGESQPARRFAEPIGVDVPVLEARNCAFMGTTVSAGAGKAVVYATGSATEFGRIYRLAAEAPQQQTPLQRQMAIMARRVSAVALSIGAVLFGVQAVASHAIVASFVFALGVMVALVPEGLPATLSVALAAGVRRMARRKALIKRLLAVEALGGTTVICTDKTGTLTQAEMTVVRCWSGGQFHGVSGVGYEPVGDVEGGDEVAGLLRVAALCSNARLLPPVDAAGWRVLGDTTEGALIVAAMKSGHDLDAEQRLAPRVAEFPFDPVRKLMTTVHRARAGHEAYVKGAPMEVLDRCTHVVWDGRRRSLDDQLRDVVRTADDAMARQSLRVLGVATRAVATDRWDRDHIESELTLIGLVGMVDPPRPEVDDAVQACHRAGIRIVMVTGDHALTAEAIARRVGIVRGTSPRLVRGAELAALDEAGLAAVLTTPGELLFCRVAPEDKMRIVAALERLGEVVAVTGDGANDAPALKRADIGVAMGASGTDVAREAAEIVLLDDSFASIVAAVELGRSVYRNIGRFLIYIFCSNVGELTPIIAATVSGFPLVPVTAIQVLSIDLGTDVLPALALGTEPPEPDTMDRPPRPRNAALFSGEIVRRVLFLGGIEGLGVAAVFFWQIHNAGLPFGDASMADPAYRKAATLAQAAIVVSQVFVGLAVRSDRASLRQIGLLSNPRYVVAQVLGVGVVAAISYLGPLQSVFNTAPLTAADWALAAVPGVMLLTADEVRKWLLRRSS